MKLATIAAAAVAALAMSADGAILFDFGPAGATQNPTNSPAHAVGAVPATEVTWNRVSLASVTSITNSDGTAATGVSLTYGIAAAGQTNVSYGTAPSSTSGGGGSVGIYQLSSAIKTAVFNNSTTSILGVRIDGLPAGEYDVFTAARNTATSTAGTTSRVYYGVGAAGSAFETASAASLDQSNSQSVTLSGSNASFVLGNQYQKFTANVAGGNSLYIAFKGVTNETRPFVNAIEIVAVPEPGMLSLLVVAGLPLLAGRARRKA